jgi:hypothetical protein
MTKKLKVPGDYPQLSFRVSEDQKAMLTFRLDDLLAKIKATQNDDEKTFKRNDLIVLALFEGMTKIEEDLSKEKKVITELHR